MITYALGPAMAEWERPGGCAMAASYNADKIFLYIAGQPGSRGGRMC